MKTIQLSCGACAKLFEKTLKEHTRQLKRGRTQFFCSLSCSARICLAPHGKINPQNLKRGRGDEFSPYRFFLKQATKRSKYNKTRTCDIDLDYLKTLWEEQKGICPLTVVTSIDSHDESGRACTTTQRVARPDRQLEGLRPRERSLHRPHSQLRSELFHRRGCRELRKSCRRFAFVVVRAILLNPAGVVQRQGLSLPS